MQLSLTQTAQLLGKTRRQVEYLIRQGRLKAQKQDGRWRIDEADLPLSAGQRQAVRRRADALRDSALNILERDAPRPAYSMTDLKAFQVTSTLWHDGCADLSAEHPAVPQLHTAIQRLAVGCHRFERADKAQAYHAARDALALAACALHLDPSPQHQALARRIEDEAIPAVAGLMRRHQGRGQDPQHGRPPR